MTGANFDSDERGASEGHDNYDNDDDSEADSGLKASADACNHATAPPSLASASGSIDASLNASPALRPCSPTSSQRDIIDGNRERMPLSPLTTEVPNLTNCQLDVLSQMASQVNNG